MLSFRHSQPIYSLYPASGGSKCSPYSFYDPHTSFSQLVADPEARYRRALTDYLAAEEEYKALLRAREEARLRARVEDALRRQERARLLRAEIARARREQQVRQLREALAAALSRDITPYLCAHVARADDAVVEESPESPWDSSAGRSSAEDEPQPQCETKENTRDGQPPLSPSEQDESSVPSLESLLRERLQEIVGDEEVQDVAHAILRHLTPVAGVSHLPAIASSINANTFPTQPPEGADLSRSDALQGVAAEVVKESFKAHRAEAAKRDDSSISSPTSKMAPSLAVVQDIRSALTKLSSDFSFPPSLDFDDDEPDGLAYTPSNAPVRVYEHALDGLLAQLDAVETDGEEEVRVARRATVKEVEKAIEDVERRIAEARESAKLSSIVGAVISPEGVLAKDKDAQPVVHAGLLVDNDNKPKVDGPSPSIPESHLDPKPSGPEASSLQRHEDVLRHDTTSAISEPIPGDLRRDQPSTPVLETISQAVTEATPTSTLSPTDQDVASPIPSGDSLGSKQEALADQTTTDQTTSVPLEPSTFTTPLESPTEVILGTIAPSSTPASPMHPSPVIPEDILASLSEDELDLLREPEGKDDSSPEDSADERDWIEIEP